MKSDIMQKQSFWTLNKTIVVLTLITYFLLIMELRVEHMDEFGDHWQAWIPLAYSAIMISIGIWGLRFWKKAGRKVLFGAFAISIIVGILGVWFHEKGKPLNSIIVIAQAWQAPIVQHRKPETGNTQPLPQAVTNDGKKKKKKPKPPLAPLSFAGIGVLGMLACWKDDTANV
jgi:hypothetical protein